MLDELSDVDLDISLLVASTLFSTTDLNCARKAGLPWWLSGKESTCQCRRYECNPRPGKSPHASEHLSPYHTTTEPVFWSPYAATTEAQAPRARAPQQEKSPQREACTTREELLTTATRGKPTQQQRLSTAKRQTNKLQEMVTPLPVYNHTHMFSESHRSQSLALSTFLSCFIQI